MAIFGITDAGFSLKRLSDILSDMQLSLSRVTDPVSGEALTPDLLDENDPLIQIVNAFCDSLSAAWEELQLAYNQFDPLKATGAGLSGLVQLNGLQRGLGTYATATFDMTGTPLKTITTGKQVSDMADLYIFTLPEFTFDGSGLATAIGTCTVKGVVEAVSGSLVKILTPVSGFNTVTNTSDSTGGTADETDAALRARQQLSTSKTASSIIDSIFAVLSNIEDVEHVRVYQNRTLSTDSRNIPAKSVAVVIVGGDEVAISQAIFNTIPLGVETYGTTETTQTDAQGQEYAIDFSRPAEINIHVSIGIEVVNSALWPSDGEEKIVEYILNWATLGATGIGITEGYDQTGFLPGESVYASELYVPVNKQLGIRIGHIYVGTAAFPTESVVPIAWNEIAKFNSTNISIGFIDDSSI